MGRSSNRVKLTEKLFAGGSRTRVGIFGKIEADGRFRRVRSAFEEISPDIVRNDAQNDVGVDRGSGKKGVISDEPAEIRVSDIAVGLQSGHQVETDPLSRTDARRDQPLVDEDVADLTGMT
ncbi:MAG: hypothetical protein JWO14_926 [Solirubrobacterales bacterium]|nr:hypothetical protein [Solirubrobacterales bacterium]